MPWIQQPTERSLACNGEIVEFFRKQRGWTQEELSKASGFSVRLVAKAESSGGLAPDSIEVLAETLSSPEQKIYPEDLTSSPKRLAAAYLNAVCEYESETVSKCRHLLSEDLTVYVPGGDACTPLSGVHEGIEGLDTYFKNFFQIFERPDKELAKRTAVISEDGNRVVLACFEKITNEFIPPDVEGAPLTLYMVFSRGKLCKLQLLFDTTNMGPIVTAWRDKYDGIIDVKRQYMSPWENGG